ncbi:MAG TPA: TCR/Tet family MFS transporter [Rhizomicrobium sp.]|nr:TCR/Tet family MFS transporter [Rhizomicrobium sp.]
MGEATRASRFALLFIFITMFVDTVGLGIIIPVMPKLIASLIGGTLSQAAPFGGWLADAYMILQFLCAPLVGNLSDRFGRRPVLILSLVALGIDYVIMGLAPTIVWLFIGRCLSGAAGATYSTVNAYIADVSPPERRAANFGLTGAAFGLGFIAGPALGGLLSQYGLRVPFFASAALAFANALYGYVVLKESLAQKDRRKFDIARANPVGSLVALSRFPALIGLFGVFILYRFAHDANPAVWTYYTMYKFQWTSLDVGYAMMVMGLLMAFISGYLTRLIIPRIGEERAAYLGFVAGGIGFVGYAFATQGWMMYGWMPLAAFMGLAGPALNGVMSRQLGPDEQGELQGALASLGSLTSIAAMPSMSYLFAWFTSDAAPVHFPGAAFLTAGLFMLAAAALFARARPAPALSPAE